MGDISETDHIEDHEVEIPEKDIEESAPLISGKTKAGTRPTLATGGTNTETEKSKLLTINLFDDEETLNHEEKSQEEKFPLSTKSEVLTNVSETLGEYDSTQMSTDDMQSKQTVEDNVTEKSKFLTTNLEHNEDDQSSQSSQFIDDLLTSEETKLLIPNLK